MIEVVGIGGSMKSQPYFAKLEKIIVSMGWPYVYTCWQRSNAPDFYSRESNNKNINLLYTRGVEGSRGLIFHYFVWMILLFLHFFRQRGGNRLYIVSRFDAAFPLYVVSMIFPVRYVYLDRDALYLSHNWPDFVARILRSIEARIGMRAVAHIIPGRSRDFTHANNVCVVENSPHSEFIHAASSSRYYSARVSGALSVYVNGWLVESRGMDMIEKAARCLSEARAPVKFLVAGVLACDAAKRLASLDNVEYFGVLENVDALALYSRADVVLSFYDPSIQINQRAEPNKWLDCAVQKVPFITNNGVLTAEKWLNAGVAFSVDYDGSDELSDLLIRLYKNRGILKRAVSGYSLVNIQAWDIAMSKALSKAYEYSSHA